MKVNLKLTLEELNADNQLFIDVRNPEELYKQGIIPGAKNFEESPPLWLFFC